MSRQKFGRRKLLTYGLSGAAAVGATGFELVSHGVLPGQHELDELDGACSVAATDLEFAVPGRSISGSFYSHARNLTVGYTIGYPPGPWYVSAASSDASWRGREPHRRSG